jgi:hypothetical protein
MDGCEPIVAALGRYTVSPRLAYRHRQLRFYFGALFAGIITNDSHQ